MQLARATHTNHYRLSLLADLTYIAVFIIVVGTLAVRQLWRRLVN